MQLIYMFMLYKSLSLLPWKTFEIQGRGQFDLIVLFCLILNHYFTLALEINSKSSFYWIVSHATHGLVIINVNIFFHRRYFFYVNIFSRNIYSRPVFQSGVLYPAQDNLTCSNAWIRKFIRVASPTFWHSSLFPEI